jgi:hypothetical protein
MHGNLKFISEENQMQYEKNGYLTIPLLNTGQVAQLAQIFHRHFNITTVPTVYDTVADTPVDRVRQVHEEINEVCKSALHNLVQNFRIAASIFIIKKSGEDSYKGVHLDASMTAQGYNNVGIWIPLCDIDEQTGRMCLFGNSQHFLPPYSTPSMPNSFEQTEDMVEKHLTCFSMKKGEALFFNNNMIHCTQKNTSGKTRIAAVIKLLDENAPLVTAYYDSTAAKDEMVSLYQHEEAFFLPAAFKSQKPPINSRFIGYVPGLPKIFSETELANLIEQYSS